MTTFQDAKDSFYVQMRNRLAVVNPDRTMVVRGAARPAVLVAENELEPGSGSDPRNAFVLHWGAVEADTSEAMPLEKARCQICFTTAGSPEFAGMDRGRTLSAMRSELGRMLMPDAAAVTGYAGASPEPMPVPVFWTGIVAESSDEKAGVLRCTCAVEVFAWRVTA